MAFSSYLDHLIFSGVLVALAVLLTWLMMRMRILDVPNVRSSHARPIPNSGGVAIVATVCFGVLAVLIFSDRLQVVEGIMPALGLAATTVVAVGFLDDLGRLRSFKIKLGTQILASCVLLFFNIVITRLNVPLIGQIELGWWGYPITLIWILGLTNIVNFMDALGIEKAAVVAHDWGGIIGFKLAIDWPERVTRLALLDTLCTVWVPAGIHGYWFKAAPHPEELFADHHDGCRVCRSGRSLSYPAQNRRSDRRSAPAGGATQRMSLGSRG